MGWIYPNVFSSFYNSSMGERLHRYPEQRWLRQLSSIWYRGIALGLTFVVATTALNSSRFRNWFDRVSPQNQHRKVTPKSRWTRKPFYILGSIVLAAQFIDVLMCREHWPFSHFPMYTGIQTEDYLRYRVEGVLADGTEVSLVNYMVPLSPGKVSNVIANHGANPKQEHYQRSAREFFDWYETNRMKSRHDGPEIKATRVYALNWLLREDASNIDSPVKTLLGEYQR